MPLRILTINLYNDRAQCDSVAEALRQFEPDVVAAQELSSRGAEVLDEWGDYALLDPQDDMTGMGIAARRPAEFSRMQYPNRNPVVARFDAADVGFTEGVELVNAHLVNPISRPLRESKRLRRLEGDALTELLTKPYETSARVLAGDLNSSPAWPMYRRLAAVATDAAVEAGNPLRSWGPTPTSPRMLRIDHVFTQGARCTSAQLVDVAGADHRGLLVELEPTR
ncbi:MAG: endonuclease/exonuclease/phosphatase family protein [bacterium]|nr:endonuclease/exonuclease/phosphatase family protein [bacterium]